MALWIRPSCLSAVIGSPGSSLQAGSSLQSGSPITTSGMTSMGRFKLHGAYNIRVFGSVSKECDKPGSDVVFNSIV